MEELYRKMYAKLCVGISEAVDLLKDPGNCLYVSGLLQKALYDAEELYMTYEDHSNHSHPEQYTT